MQEKIYLYLSFGIGIASLISIIALKSHLPPIVPIFFGQPVGSEQLASVWWLEAAPVSSLIITSLNFWLSRLAKDAFLSKILVFSAFFVSVLTLVTLIKIVLLIGLF